GRRQGAHAGVGTTARGPRGSQGGCEGFADGDLGYWGGNWRPAELPTLGQLVSGCEIAPGRYASLARRATRTRARACLAVLVGHGSTAPVAVSTNADSTIGLRWWSSLIANTSSASRPEARLGNAT